ncbi:MAG TPA: GIY-YIG nuclease family protein [Microbacteriaceae bacterium]|nr:GIY-YIG nuclease family protein [Microbacteriaceae bacterium]
MAFTYLLRCADNSYYAGSTLDLDARVEQHGTGLGSVYTSTRLPVELVWFQEFESLVEAYGWERKLHGWSRAKKESLIEGRWGDLAGYSRRARGR